MKKIICLLMVLFVLGIGAPMISASESADAETGNDSADAAPAPAPEPLAVEAVSPDANRPDDRTCTEGQIWGTINGVEQNCVNF